MTGAENGQFPLFFPVRGKVRNEANKQSHSFQTDDMRVDAKNEGSKHLRALNSRLRVQALESVGDQGSADRWFPSFSAQREMWAELCGLVVERHILSQENSRPRSPGRLEIRAESLLRISRGFVKSIEWLRTGEG